MKRVFELEFAGKSLKVEVGEIAKQADGAVLVRFNDTVILSTACAQKEPKEGTDFFPLTVGYEEKQYAVGKIPGSFLRREGRPGEHATLTARLIDRPIDLCSQKALEMKYKLLIQLCQLIKMQLQKWLLCLVAH